MDAETQAVTELMEISYQSTKYLYRFIAAVFKHGSQGAAALTALIQSVLSGSNKAGATKMQTLLKNSGGITGFTLAAADYEAFRHQAEEMKILYVPVRAETNPELLTIITSDDKAALVSQIIAVNGLDGFMNGTLEQTEQTGTEEAQLDQQEAENPYDENIPVNPEAVEESADFFSQFEDSAEPEMAAPTASATEPAEDFFAAMTTEPEVEPDEIIYHQEFEKTAPEIVEVSAAELQEQPQEIQEAMRAAGYFSEPQEAEHPITPEVANDHPSGSALKPSNDSLIPTAEKPSIRDRVENIKVRQKSGDTSLSGPARELIQDKKPPTMKL